MVKTKQTFRAELVDETGALNVFETDQAETDLPTLYLETDPKHMKKGSINRVHFRFNQTNAVTCELFLFANARAGNLASEATKVFDSRDWEDPLVDDDEYDIQDLDIPINIKDNSGKIYYLLNWSGAPGNTPGYLVVEGEIEI